MKKISLLLLAVVVTMTACTNTTTTTNAGGDSTAVAATDSNKMMIDTPDVIVVAPTDSPSTAVVAGDSNTTGRKANPNDPQPIVTTNRMIISFISIGGGIDYKAKEKYDAFLKTYEKTNKVTLAHETVTWGREGEVDYCFKLAELKDPKKTDFVRQSMNLFTGNELVKFKENANCRIQRK